MLISEDAQHRLFSDSNPHFTPEWLSRRVADCLSPRFIGLIIDPACGAGNLLAAAAIRCQSDGHSGGNQKFIGVDTSKKSVQACRLALSEILPEDRVSVVQADFLRMRVPITADIRVGVVMNPPFQGYGSISRRRRTECRRTGLQGRFNLSYAFVVRAIQFLKPDILVSLLPSNWAHSRDGAFRSKLSSLGGDWEWDDIGDWPDKSVSAHVGVLVWRPRSRSRAVFVKGHRSSRGLNVDQIRIRQGVATGNDNAFVVLASQKLSLGRTVAAVRGRDLDRGTSEKIWMPPSTLTSKQVQSLSKEVSRGTLLELKARSCVRMSRRQLFEYHEANPEWFLGEPKVLIPEVLSGPCIRVEFDEQGTKLPLHSVIAVKVGSRKIGRKVASYLRGPKQQAWLLSHGPKLSGGATRLQVGALRELLTRLKLR